MPLHVSVSRQLSPLCLHVAFSLCISVFCSLLIRVSWVRVHPYGLIHTITTFKTLPSNTVQADTLEGITPTHTWVRYVTEFNEKAQFSPSYNFTITQIRRAETNARAGKALGMELGFEELELLSLITSLCPTAHPDSVPGGWRRQAWEMTVFCDFTVFSILLQSAVLNLSASASLEAGWKHRISGPMPDYTQSGAQVISWCVNTLKLRHSNRDKMWSDLIVPFCRLPLLPTQHCRD